jgi:hypothetical protein
LHEVGVARVHGLPLAVLGRSDGKELRNLGQALLDRLSGFPQARKQLTADRLDGPAPRVHGEVDGGDDPPLGVADRHRDRT